MWVQKLQIDVQAFEPLSDLLLELFDAPSVVFITSFLYGLVVSKFSKFVRLRGKEYHDAFNLVSREHLVQLYQVLLLELEVHRSRLLNFLQLCTGKPNICKNVSHDIDHNSELLR